MNIPLIQQLEDYHEFIDNPNWNSEQWQCVQSLLQECTDQDQNIKDREVLGSYMELHGYEVSSEFDDIHALRSHVDKNQFQASILIESLIIVTTSKSLFLILTNMEKPTIQ